MDWKHIVLGAVVAMAPAELHYLGGVDWSALGPMWSSMIVGALQIANEVIPNLSGSSTGGLGMKK